MAIPTWAPREPGGGHTERSHPFERYSASHSQPFTSSNFAPGSMAMGIPNHRQTEDDIAPPPLPPPRYVGPGPMPEPSRFPTPDRRNGGFSLESQTSSLDSLGHSPRGFRKEFHRDEGYHSISSNLGQSQDAASKTRFMTHDQFQFRPSGSDYDSSLLKKFDARRTLDNQLPPRRSGISSSLNEPASRRDSLDQRQLPSLSLPIRSNSRLYGDASASETGQHSSNLAAHGYGVDYRSPIEPTDFDRSPPHRSKRTNSGSVADDVTVSTQGSYENNGDDVDFPMEDAGMGRLRIEESAFRGDYHTIGQKRRASSPPGDDFALQGLPGAGELLRRREGASRASPTPRLTIPQNAASPFGRSGSYVNSLPMTATSAASMASSFGRRSPGGLSPSGLSPVDGMCNSPYSTPISLTHSPRSAMSRVPHQRQSSISRIQGFYMCECCPKKPKKFETAEELGAHAAEKQYECSFCGNRFKNKNEAERHQNSLHVRRHSWSCSALHVAGYDKAFHESTNRPGEADACGYCGEEFLRSGGPGRARHPTEQDWDDRLRHLQEVHKFRECNSSKKFFRADHFRQHLKHSHAGTSGKWTNMLETACMIEEEAPQPR
ncbi:hypothetical protein BKA67DRAFT_193710 [Truncatella angustata]|uniref:C2H2-type domain-containing protein n=1 Tax=Truncatella angustata TaxID=152316 RepID=A0A9P9A0U0_9PEZI|nr:uncharacterized protein BKA67DRAFT_193710 [Truncatella angustata]KAH6657618.1 hypothetical protein BKA67DRAFT_193710 [Truncatella angustata]